MYESTKIATALSGEKYSYPCIRSAKHINGKTKCVTYGKNRTREQAIELVHERE